MVTKATFGPGNDVGLEVDADYSVTGQFRFFKQTGGQATIATAQGEFAPLVLQNDPAAAGQGGAFVFQGRTTVVLGNTVAALGKITTGADGRAEAALSGDEVLGYALEAGVVGDEVTAVIGAASAPLA